MGVSFWAWLYAANTLGGALGLVLVVGFALHVLGAAGSMPLMIGMNLAVAESLFTGMGSVDPCRGLAA